MKKKLFIITLILSVVLALFPGCQNDDSGLEIKLAPIHEVEVSIAEEFPEKAFVYITGGLADSCTTFHDLTIERIGNTINIEVTTERPRDAVCAQVYGYFEKNVYIGNDFKDGVKYLVDVNGVTVTFEYH